MNGWAILFFALIITALIGYIVLARREPGTADEIASRADGLWQRILRKFRGK